MQLVSVATKQLFSPFKLFKHTKKLLTKFQTKNLSKKCFFFYLSLQLNLFINQIVTKPKNSNIVTELNNSNGEKTRNVKM